MYYVVSSYVYGGLWEGSSRNRQTRVMEKRVKGEKWDSIAL